MTRIIFSDLSKRGASTTCTGSSARWRTCETAGKPAPSPCYCYNIGTWNVRSLVQPGKLACVIQEMNRMNVDIMGISETFWKEAGEFITNIPTVNETFKVIYSGGDNSRRGVAVILKENIAKSLMYYIPISERILALKLRDKFNDILIIQVYAPTEDTDRTEVEHFYDEVEKVIKENKKFRDKVIITGDFNAKVGSQSVKNTTGKFGLGVRNENGEKLIEFCKKHGLSITNTFFEQKETSRYTWTSPDGKTKNQIDYIIVNNRFRNSIKNSKSRPGADCGSDHNPVIIRTETKLKKIRRKFSKKKWNVSTLKQKENALQFQRKIEESVKINIEDPNENWENLKSCISTVADQVCKNDKQEMKQEWMTIEILKKMEYRAKVKLEDGNTQSDRYKKINKEIMKDCRKAKECYYQAKCEELERLDRMHSPALFKKLKEMKKKQHRIKLGIKDKNGNLIQDEDLISERWEEYIEKELYNDNRGDKPVMQNIERDFVQIEEIEIREIIKNLTRDKAPGEDGIHAEFLQNLGEKGIRILTNIINKIYQQGELPPDFVNNIFIPIPKVNKAMECSDHRTISLISHAAKILLVIIKNRITPIIERQLSETQLGFRKGRGTREAIYNLRVLSERLIEKKKEVHICFIDYTKAFDRVNHEKLIQIMQKANIPKHEIRLIVNLYWEQTAVIRTNNGMSNKVKIRRGIRQGCILSPILFNLYSEFLIREAIEEEKGIQVNGVNINNIRFADDTAIISDNEVDLQNLINRITTTCKEYGMALNVKKTKVMVITKGDSVNSNIIVDGEQLEQVEKYKYLGSWITENCSCEEEVKSRIGKAKNDFWNCKEFLRSNLNMKLKIRLLQCYIFSIVSYASETWTFNKNIRRRINAFEMWCYRRILKISWTDKIKNEEVRRRVYRRESLMNAIAKRKLRFVGHVLRGSSGDLANLVVEGLINGKRDRGKQRRKWADDAKDWTGTSSMGEIKRKAENKMSWNNMVANLHLEEGT